MTRWTSLSDSLPMDEWLRVRDRQLAGAGSDVHGRGRVMGLYPVGVEATLDPPSGGPEVSVSGIRGSGIGLPDHARIDNTPTGELDVDLGGPVKVLGRTILKKGTYEIR